MTIPTIFVSPASAVEKGLASPAVTTYPPPPSAGLVNRNRKETSGVSTTGRTGTIKTGTTVINSPTEQQYPVAGMRNPDDTNTTAVNPPENSEDSKRKQSKRRFSYWKTLVTPTKPVGETPSVSESIRNIVFATWLNVLLVFIPVSVSGFLCLRPPTATSVSHALLSLYFSSGHCTLPRPPIQSFSLVRLLLLSVTQPGY